MDGGRGNVGFWNLTIPIERLSSLAKRFRDKRYRDGYVAAHARNVLARQMRNFRGDLSQAKFAELIGKRPTQVRRLESPAYSGWSLRTMLEIARALNVAVVVRFVDFPTFLRYSADLSDRALNPKPYSEENELDSGRSEERTGLENLLQPSWNAISSNTRETGIEITHSLPISETKKIAANDNPSYQIGIEITKQKSNVR
jgi:Helix-turn-helix